MLLKLFVTTNLRRQLLVPKHFQVISTGPSLIMKLKYLAKDNIKISSGKNFRRLVSPESFLRS